MASKKRTPPAAWDAEAFLSDVRAQIDEWRGEWLRHEPHLSRLVIEIRLNGNMLGKEDARIRETGSDEARTQ